jgi:hypothetical protein
MTPDEIPRYFRARAAECERFAELTVTSHARERLLHAASRWRAMADDDERRQQPPEPSGNGQ